MCRGPACGSCPCSSTPCVGRGRGPGHSERFLKVAAEKLVKQKCAVGCCMTRQEAGTLFELVSNCFAVLIRHAHLTRSQSGRPVLGTGVAKLSPLCDFEWDDHQDNSAANTRGHSRLTSTRLTALVKRSS